MSGNFVAFLILICMINISNGHEGAEGLSNDLLLTENFFGKLINDYESMPATQDVRNEFGKKIDEFVKGLRNPIPWRQRRHLVEPAKQAGSGIGVLKGFSQTHEDPFPNVLAISVFPYYNGIQLQWFVSTLDASSVSLFLYDGNRFKLVATYPMTNGSRLIADCSEPVCVLVTSKTDGSVTILRLQTGIQGHLLRLVQYLVGSGDVRLSIWHGMNQIFLGVSSGARIAIYHWLGEHFDSIQVLDYGTGKLTPFKIGGSIYLAVTGRQTTVFRFLLQPNAFNLMQRLPPADDVESFFMDEGHRREHYLVLSNQESTIIYKFVVDHFVPFQIIAKADKISSVTTKETVVLLALTSNTMKIYQYNGWKFVELGVTMTGVYSIYPTTLDGELMLIVRLVDGTWEFNKLNWLQQSTWEVLEAEIKSWSIETMRKAERQPPAVPELDKPLRILQGYVGKLRAETVNGRNTEKLIQLSTRFDELRSNISESRLLFTQLVTKSNPKFATIRASKVSGECTLGCQINNLNTAVKSEVFDKLAKPEIREQNLKFENVKARLTGKLPCPKPAISLKNVIVSKNINGISFETLREDLLRVTGDQEVTAEHVYARISVTSALIPIKVATQSTQQELNARWIKAENLELTRGGILVPLNGPPVVVNDTKIVAKVRVTGTVHSRGSFNGAGVEKLKPVIWTNEPLKLFGNYSLRQVTVTDRITAPDLILGVKKTLNQIINEALPLDDNVPVHLKLLKQKTTWSHITADITSDWITASDDKSTVKNITGTKHSPNDLLVTSLQNDSLPLPEFQAPLCASEATVDDVETRVVSVGQASAKTLKTEYIFGAAAFNADIIDTATITSANNFTLSSKTFTGRVSVNNASLDAIEGVDFRKLLTAMISWRDPGTVKGVVNASNLIIKQLIAPNGFVPPPISRARNLYSEGNIKFDTLNTADISALVDSVVKLDETVYFRSVAFAGLMANAVRTSVPPIDLSGTRNLGTKTIAGNLKAANLVLPYSFVYPAASNIPVNLIVEGSATFPIEPKIVNINGQNLGKIADNIWLVNKPSVIFNGALIIEHMTLQGPVQISGWLNSKTHGPWNETSNYILSREKPQVINSGVYLKTATARNVISVKAESKLVVPATFLDGLGERSLTKDGIQSFSTSVRFQKLIILGDLNAKGEINGKNLSTDVVRFDAAEENIVTGKKIVLKLIAENVIGGLNFSEWEKNILKTEPLNPGKPIVINGIKIFSNIGLSKPLRVEGLLKGLKIENYLLKSIPQEIIGTKNIDGSITASKILLNGLVNDVNLTDLVNHQLKRNKPLQIVRSLISAEGDITITGNLIVDSLYHGVALKDLDKLNSELELVAGRMSTLKLVAKKIYAALLRSAWYWNKLELIETNATGSISEPVKSNTVDFGSLGSCVSENGLLTCDNETVRLLIFASNTSEVLLNRVFQSAGAPLFVIATADPNGGVWLYTYDSAGRKFHQVAGLNLPGATRASAISVKGSLWLAVQLTWDMIILRYEAWGQFEEYNLPGSELFYMETAPTGELLLFRSDGVWRLGGVSGPRQLARIPLIGNISTEVVENDYYIQLERDKIARLKTRYVGN